MFTQSAVTAFLRISGSRKTNRLAPRPYATKSRLKSVYKIVNACGDGLLAEVITEECLASIVR